MLGSDYDLLIQSIDYLEHFEGIPEEVLTRYNNPNSNLRHNNRLIQYWCDIQMLVWDSDFQPLMDRTVVVGLKTFKRDSC